MSVVNVKNKVILSTHEGYRPMQHEIKDTPTNKEKNMGTYGPTTTSLLWLFELYVSEIMSMKKKN